MKLHDAKFFREQMDKLDDLDTEDLYHMRNILPSFFQDGFCTLGVYKLFEQQIKDAIYRKLGGFDGNHPGTDQKENSDSIPLRVHRVDGSGK